MKVVRRKRFFEQVGQTQVGQTQWDRQRWAPCSTFGWLEGVRVVVSGEVASIKHLPPKWDRQSGGTDMWDRQVGRHSGTDTGGTDGRTDRQTDGQAETYIPPFHGG